VVFLKGLATCGAAISRKAIAIVADFIQTRINDAVPATDHSDFSHFAWRFVYRERGIGEDNGTPIGRHLFAISIRS
jgi:hypothetical protein